ncbi:hypothetical protein SAMD00019534_098120 [Acytostelium subglobosum LB1]|uniref:hypothetical protein n=1 Tax=Acytostelium subglobosum LB1 TaxID=1410327 RepID=UPI0006451242|nr:hypothetical protein SAMD00019534_098120 [Acytostelium subglobosum LB1]GAM26637.1 hypothetical protein SAMD00019534_098120 [Acytostelium subglobosum LB1]|eukprot:XP_012750298.1 hypothetical protein SAMD00019534_098120 [Acytostelium subglobosum LB1]
MNNPTSSWIEIGDWFVCKREFYQMTWDVKDDFLLQNILVAAPNGGPIAVTRDKSKAVELTAQNSKPYLHIYSASGQHISSIELKETEWKASVIVIMYNIFCEEQCHYTYPTIRDEVRECKIFNGGVVMLTAIISANAGVVNDRVIGWRFYYIELNKPAPIQFADIMDMDINGPSAWDIVEPHMTATSVLDVELLVATRGSIYRVNSSEAKNQLLSHNFVKLVVSPCGFKMACISPSATQDCYDLYIYRTDCSRHIKYLNAFKKLPRSTKWSGSDGVMFSWNINQVNSLKYFEEGQNIVVSSNDCKALHIVTEIDGLRIISERSTDFFCRVPSETRDIFSIGSFTSASMLYAATEEFLNHSPKADEFIRGIRADLEVAVNTCINAAGFEYNASEQSKLLRAASFGKCFLDNYNPQLFVQTCKALRVLNAVRYYEIGIPLTLEQYNYIGAEGLIRCLIERRLHLLAWRICDYLKIKADFVLVHWACTKVRTNEDEEVLSKIIINKLQAVPGISYANIASAAHSAGRKYIATKLLDFEPKAADQVPPLLTMNQREMALNKAIESGDTNLIHLVLLNLERNEPRTYLDTVFSRKVALDLLLSFSKQKGNVGLLKKIYEIRGQTTDLALLHLGEGFRSMDMDMRKRSFEDASRIFNASKDKDVHIYSKMVDDQIKLESLQKELDTMRKDPNKEPSYMGLSLSDTIFQLVLMGEHKRVAKMLKEFKVSDKRFWWIKIKALSVSRQWEELSLFANEKKSPIGYEPFVEVCLDQSQHVEALKYIPKIQDVVNRCQCYVQVNYFREAAETAFKDKNMELLNFVAKKCTNPEVTRQIDQMRAQLQK